MPHYCSNSVLFIGTVEAVAAIRQVFAEIEQRQSQTCLYHLPDFIQSDNGFMQDIVADRTWINYETRWSPNTQVLAQLADHYGLNFISKYSEPMSGSYGEAVYKDGSLTAVNRNRHDPKLPGGDPELAALRLLQHELLYDYRGPER